MVEGEYVWGVQAFNDFSETAYTIRDFMVDTTAPARPVPVSPTTGQIFEGVPIQLIWNRPETGGSAISDSVYLSTDSLDFFDNIIGQHSTANTYFNVSLSDNGDYYWCVRSVDDAGNRSMMSIIRKFIIQSK